MSALASRAPQAPRGDGEVYWNPAPDGWASAAQAGRTAALSRVFWGLNPLSVRLEALGSDEPRVVSAHQPVIFHPGIWAKSLAASALSRLLGWKALHKITDQDAPGAVDGWIPQTRPLGFRPHALKWSHPGWPYAFQMRPETLSVREMLESVAWASIPSGQEASAFISTRLQALVAASADWNDWHRGCLETLDHASGTVREYFRASRLWEQSSFLRFLSHWIANSSVLVGAYNRALDLYREQHNILHPLTPVPNLALKDGWLETPFWVATPEKDRETLWVRPEGRETVLRSGLSGDVWTWNSTAGFEALTGAPWRLWPKALVQSLYTRLFVADFFIHGLGGGFYEPVNDLFLKELGEGPAAPYGVVSATMLLDPASETWNRETLEKAERVPHWRRVFEKNPEDLVRRKGDWSRELPSDLAEDCRSAVEETGLNQAVDDKKRWVEALGDPTRRHEAGQRMKEWNIHWVGRLSDLYNRLDAHQASLEGQREAQEGLSFREYAFFCYPPRRFRELQDTLDRMIRKD